MPVALTYPGVYIEELSSGQHTITGVATSIAAFIGWAPQGPTTEAVMVQSFPEFQSIFGTFVPGVYLAYAVSQFFQNGGQQAYIVRLVGSTAAPASEPWPTGAGVTLYASNPGVWGNSLVVTLTTQPSPNQARFSLLVQLANASGALTTLESYANLSCSATDPQYVVAVINADSNYLTFTAPGSTTAQTVTGTPPVGVTTINFTTAETGVDGDILHPGSITTPQEFETALNATTSGLSLLNQVPIFNLLCVPGETDAATISALQTFCNTHRAFLIVDAPQNASIQNLATTLAAPYGTSTNSASTPPNTEALSASAAAASNSAYYFPWVLAPDPLWRQTGAVSAMRLRGRHLCRDRRQPRRVEGAGGDRCDADRRARAAVQSDRSAERQAEPAGGSTACASSRSTATVVWGARTLPGQRSGGSQWKYVPIRRLALFLESSLYDGTQWVVFEPNDEPLVGSDPAQCRRVYAGPVSAGRVRRDHAAAGLLREVRCREQSARRASRWASSTSWSASRRCTRRSSS